jgi:hypothetical protein
MPPSLSTGTKEMIAAARRLQTSIRHATIKAVKSEGVKVLKVAKTRTPKDKGMLRASGYVNTPVVGGNGAVSCEIGFGAPGSGAEDYALAVHEHPSSHSPPSWLASSMDSGGHQVKFTVGGPKFLESALTDAEFGMKDRIAASVRESINKP